MTTDQIIQEVEEIKTKLTLTNRSCETQETNWILAAIIQQSRLIDEQNQLLTKILKP
jgi:hypothetical protein